jgi:hypothetical protein
MMSIQKLCLTTQQSIGDEDELESFGVGNEGE